MPYFFNIPITGCICIFLWSRSLKRVLAKTNLPDPGCILRTLCSDFYECMLLEHACLLPNHLWHMSPKPNIVRSCIHTYVEERDSILGMIYKPAKWFVVYYLGLWPNQVTETSLERNPWVQLHLLTLGKAYFLH